MISPSPIKLQGSNSGGGGGATRVYSNTSAAGTVLRLVAGGGGGCDVKTSPSSGGHGGLEGQDGDNSNVCGGYEQIVIICPFHLPPSHISISTLYQLPSFAYWSIEGMAVEARWLLVEKTP